MSSYLTYDIIFHKQVNDFIFPIILLSSKILVLTGSRSLKATDFVFCTDVVKPYYVASRFNLEKSERRLLNLKVQSVPRCKHFSSRLQKQTCCLCKWNNSLFVLRQIQNT
jgi:hypothetical protein